MGKFIFWIVIIFAALLVLRLINLRQQKKKTPKGSAAMGRPAEAMVRCAHCGVYLPRSEALLVDGTLRCHDKDCA
jgi:uncharacterized protein